MEKEPVLVKEKDFDFETWITIYPDLMDKFHELDEKSARIMREIVEEMFRRGFSFE